MNSKVLTNEYSTTLGDGTVMYYGTPNETKSDVITITVKGKFQPTQEKTDYQKDIGGVKSAFMKYGTDVLDKVDWVSDYYILTSDFTERGISSTKACKMKYQMYISPKQTGRFSGFKSKVIRLGKAMNHLLKRCLSDKGFKMVNKA